MHRAILSDLACTETTPRVAQQGSMKRRRRAIQALRQRMQFPNTLGYFGFPFRRIMRRYLETEAIRLQESLHFFRAPKEMA